jgi:hypothetical protein
MSAMGTTVQLPYEVEGARVLISQGEGKAALVLTRKSNHRVGPLGLKLTQVK